MDLEDFNSAPEAVIRATLLACCDVRSWSDAVIDGRPYADASDALRVAGTAALAFTPDEVDHALAAHPRIGERAAGATAEAVWSRKEQSGVATDAQTRAALLAGNGAYEVRFDRVFLIDAAGLDATTVLAELHRRLENAPDAEATEVARELRGIAVRRLARVLELELEDELAEERS